MSATSSTDFGAPDCTQRISHVSASSHARTRLERDGQAELQRWHTILAHPGVLVRVTADDGGIGAASLAASAGENDRQIATENS
jgi:hypothetical protein